MPPFQEGLRIHHTNLRESTGLTKTLHEGTWIADALPGISNTETTISASGCGSHLRLEISPVSGHAIPRWKNTEAVWAKMRRYPLTLPCRKFRNSGKVEAALFLERRDPKPATHMKPSTSYDLRENVPVSGLTAAVDVMVRICALTARPVKCSSSSCPGCNILIVQNYGSKSDLSSTASLAFSNAQKPYMVRELRFCSFAIPFAI